MASIVDFVKKQKPGAQFVITAQMLKLRPQDFDRLANIWIDDGGPGFNVMGVPHRTVVDGEFLISRVTVIRTTAPLYFASCLFTILIDQLRQRPVGNTFPRGQPLPDIALIFYLADTSGRRFHRLRSESSAP
jgi:hypothetical protein